MSGDALDTSLVSALRSFGSRPGELLDVMLRQFLVEAPALLADIESATEWTDHEWVERAAHRLKGTAGHVGATRVADTCRQLEHTARRREWRLVWPLVALTSREVRRALEAATAVLEPDRPIATRAARPARRRPARRPLPPVGPADVA